MIDYQPPTLQEFLDTLEKLSKYGKLCSFSMGHYSVSYHAEPDKSIPEAINNFGTAMMRAQGNHIKGV